MRTKKLVVGLFVLVVCLSEFAFCQDEPPIRLSLDERLNLVLSANGFETLGVDITSPSGSLVPIPPGDLTADPSPFTFLLANQPSQITLATLGQTITIDGDITLDARWNPGGERDISYKFGAGPVPQGPFQLNPIDYDQCPDCLPQIGVALTDDLKFKLSGVGQRLNSFSLDSRSGSLLPGDSPAPFAAIGTNTTRQIDFASPDSPVVLDGEVVLNAGWNDYIGGRDVRYQYETNADGVQGPLQLSLSDYPPRPFVPGPLNAYVDASDKLVVVGAGHPLSRLSFTSASGSLVPSETAGPFANLGANTQNQIDFVSPARGSEVTLEGSLQLGAGWNASGERDVEFDYSIVGDARDAGLFRIPRTNYLDAGANPDAIVPAQQRPRFDVTLNEDAKFVVSANGRSLQSLRFNSGDRSLVPAETASPFQQTPVNETGAVWYRSFGDEVIIDGDVTLNSGWDISSPDVQYSYFSRDGSGLFFELDAADYSACRDCPVPRIGVSLDDEQRFVLTGIGQQLDRL